MSFAKISNFVDNGIACLSGGIFPPILFDKLFYMIETIDLINQIRRVL
jgi:hypothetical protein